MYKYEELKPRILTDDGQARLLKVYRRALNLLAEKKTFSMRDVLNFIVGSNWETMACVDRLVELGFINEHAHNPTGIAQDRTFYGGK
jgi:hypothetical protein